METATTPRWPFAAAIFLGALLLFAVQPMIARFLLPWFGGAAAVWTTCVLFFQAALLGGYAYAHGLRVLGPRGQVVVHLILLAAALACLPVVPSGRWVPTDSTHPVPRILILLTVTIGLPYFVLSATSPLLQSWYARVHPGANVYRLYALSNVGSLLALLAYPLAIEPTLTRAAQARGWSALFVLFALACAACAILKARHPHAAPDVNLSPPHPLTPSSSKHTLSSALLILTLTAIASAMLLAFTNKICLDVAPVPFLWVFPLAIYLLSFILTFEYTRLYRREWFMRGGLVMSVAICVVLYLRNFAPLSVQVVIYYLGLFVFCMICHGEVARLRPQSSSSLTGYYLLISLGGVFGAAFVTLAAPVLFSEYAEIHLTIVLLWVVALVILFQSSDSPLRRLRLPFAWVGILNTFLLVVVLLYIHAFNRRPGRVFVHRSFYGVLEVQERIDKPTGLRTRTLIHNGIDHGAQFIAGDRRRSPTSYYVSPAGIAVAVGHLHPEQPRRIGVLGLGSGVMASFAKAGDTIRFYELDPAVADVARSHFTHLSDCPAKVDLIIGDGRLSLARETPQDYDLLVLDAFSGDAVPVHLLTLEAFDLYLRHLKPNGVLAVNVTNRHLNLFPPVLAAAEHCGLKAAWFATDRKDTAYASDWIILSSDAAFMDAITDAPSNRPLPAHHTPPWTDEHAALFPLLR
jgi:hypothetical protein